MKVQRGLKSYDTTVTEGQRIYYNFVKPHVALKGQTPTSVAGITIGNKNKWLELHRLGE